MWQRFAGVRLRWEKAGRAQMNRRIAQMAARWVIRLLMYALLICLSFVLLYPLLYAFSQAFRTQADIYNANVIWIPTAFTWDNFRVLWKGIDYPRSLKIRCLSAWAVRFYRRRSVRSPATASPGSVLGKKRCGWFCCC